MERHLNVLNFAKPLTGMDIASGGGTSFHLQPKVAATDSHRRLSFSGGSKETGDASEDIGVPRRASRLSLASGKSSLASGRSDCISEELSVAKSECIPEPTTSTVNTLSRLRAVRSRFQHPRSQEMQATTEEPTTSTVSTFSRLRALRNRFQPARSQQIRFQPTPGGCTHPGRNSPSSF
jgi:hypothetical protein